MRLRPRTDDRAPDHGPPPAGEAPAPPLVGGATLVALGAVAARGRAVVVVVLVAALSLLAGRGAHAGPPAPVAVTPIPSSPPPPTAPSQPHLDEALASVRALEGRVVTRVEAVVEDPLWPDIRAPRLDAPAGTSLSGALARRLLDGALASGQFADGIAMAADDGRGGATLTIRLSPRKIIGAVHVALHDAPITRDEIAREADLAEGGELVARDIPRLKARIASLLARQGFPAANVAIGTSAGRDSAHVVVTIDVVAGPPRRIDRKVFFFTRGKAEDFTTITQAYRVLAGDRASDAAIAAANADLEAKLRAGGFHRAAVTSDLVAAGAEVILRVRMDPGPRFSPRFEGNDHYDASVLEAALGVADDPDLSLGHLVQKLSEYYRKRGYLDVEVSAEVRGKLDGPLVVLAFTIREHPRVQVLSREYPCLRESELSRVQDAPRTFPSIGGEIDSYLDEELPGQDFFQSPRPSGLDGLIGPHTAGTRVTPTDLKPRTTYLPDTYDRAVKHVQELYRAEGFLSAEVGPVQVVRPTCAASSPAGTCVPVPVIEQSQGCHLDLEGLPQPLPPPDARLGCTPDPAKGVVCAPYLALRIPIRLGPQSTLYDASFVGVRAFTTRELAKTVALEMGQAASSAKLDEARRRVVDAYQRRGYAFAEATYTLSLSQDRSRAHVRFRVNEQPQVFVAAIKIRGNVYTKLQTIEKRIALEIGKPYGSEEVRKTQERIATLNVFSSVAVALEDPNVPQRNKTVVVTVVERPRHSVEIAPGLSTGEGARVAVEYGHKNLFGRAIGFTALLQLSYLPTAFILDSTARQNYESLPFEARLGSRATVGIQFPEIGLGPLVGFGIDAVGTHDLRRDYYLTKFAFTPSITVRPLREITLQFGQGVEFNNLRILAASNLREYLVGLASQSGVSSDQLFAQARILNLPDGETLVVAQRGVFTWDRRDNPLDATRGTLLVSSVEHVDAYPLLESGGSLADQESHFMKYFNKFSFYLKAPWKLRFASSTSIGVIQQLKSTSTTYPDRLFFLGGQDMRGWYVQQFIPQDDLDSLVAAEGSTDPNRFTLTTAPVRGGDLMAVQRFELRIPLGGPIETVVFSDVGNLWRAVGYPFAKGELPLRADVGTGLRLKTPIAPLAFDFGYNVTRKTLYEDPFAFSFSLGLF